MIGTDFPFLLFIYPRERRLGTMIFVNDHSSEEELFNQISEDWATYGWTILLTYYEERIYAHTLGLPIHFQHPDFEVYGLSEELTITFLNALAIEVRNGNQYSSHSSITTFVENYKLLLVVNPQNPLGTPLTNGRLRLIWPDAQGRYPWEPECEQECKMQSLLPDSMIPNRFFYEQSHFAISNRYH